jgi:hypothetical protein
MVTEENASPAAQSRQTMAGLIHKDNGPMTTDNGLLPSTTSEKTLAIRPNGLTIWPKVFEGE